MRMSHPLVVLTMEIMVDPLVVHLVELLLLKLLMPPIMMIKTTLYQRLSVIMFSMIRIIIVTMVTHLPRAMPSPLPELS
jgi:hypothetical protein